MSIQEISICKKNKKKQWSPNEITVRWFGCIIDDVI